MIVELIALAFTLALLYHFIVEFRGHNLPPGPTPWPLIGNFNLLSEDLHLCLTKLEEQYGKIYRLYVGHELMVVLSGDLIKEALVRQPKGFAGRPELDSGLEEKVGEGPGSPSLVIMDYGPRWKLYRKLNQTAVKVYGEDRIQEVISKEVDELCKQIAVENGKPFDVIMQFGMSFTNIIFTTITGERYEMDDPELVRIFNINSELTSITFGMSLQDVYPVLDYIFPRQEKALRTSELTKQRYDILKEKYLQHKERFDGETIHDYTDALLYTKQEAEKEDHANQEHLRDPIIVTAGMATLLTGGSDTTVTALGWAVAYLLHYPDIQERIHQEIVDHMGKDDFPNLSMRKCFPILEAFITETLRMGNVIPVAVPHKTTADVVLDGFTLPKGTRVIANIWSLHHDPAIWKDPFTFNVDRFLDEAGNFVPPTGGTLLPFGAGPRVCVGEVLARSELFLFLCRLLQQFKFENPPGSELPSLKGVSGAVLHPKPYMVRGVARSFSQLRTK